MKAFEYDSGFMKFAILLSRLTLLNLIWLIACIPVVTIGASTAAMHYSAAKLMNGDSHVFGNYKTSFRTYWKKGTVIWLITAVFSAIFGMASYLFQTARIPYHTVLMVISGMAFLTLLLVVIWIYPTMVNFSGKLQELFFNAFIFAFMYAPVTLIAVVFYGIAGFLFIRFLLTRMLVVLFGPALIVYSTLVLFEKVFKKYRPKTEES